MQNMHNISSGGEELYDLDYDLSDLSVRGVQYS